MKPILLLTLSIMTIFSTTASTVSTEKTDSEGHSLSELWKNYYKASRSDRPQDEVSALEKIKKEASKKNLAWDFYDACEKYADAKSSINWKLRSELKQQKDSEIEEFGSAVVSFYHKKKSGSSAEALREFALNNKKELLSGYNPEFCRHDGGVGSFTFGKALPELLSNDYEYALWSLLSRKPRTAALPDAKAYFKDSYPCAALLEYIEIFDINAVTQKDKKISALKDYAQKYSGKAGSLLAKQDLLRFSFDSLSSSKGAGSGDFLRLKNECESLISEIGSFSNNKEKSLAECCTYPESLLETLESSEILADYKDGVLSVYLRNLSSVKLKIVSSSSKQTITESTLKNPEKSFYVLDTVSLTLPKMSDGTYEVTLQDPAKKVSKTELEYNLYHLSLALKQTSKGHSVYVADSVTGEPSGECTLILLNEADKEIARAEINIKDGFTPLPEALSSKLVKNKWGYSVKAEKTVSGETAPLLSRSENIYKRSYRETSNADTAHQLRATLITDRGAYNIGETAYFKAILYSGTEEFKTCPAGHPVTAELFDPSGNRLSSVSLKTNDFGSVNGEFVLSKAEKGGLYRISITDGESGRSLTSLRVLADEFVLPSFSLSWDESSRVYLPGDEVSVSGSVRAYSGHLLGDVTLRYEVLYGEEVISSGETPLGSNGRFSVRFKTPEDKSYAHYTLRATITDKSGETLDFSRYIFVSGRLNSHAEITNAAKGEFETSGGEGGGDIITSDSLNLKLLLNSYSGDEDKAFYPDMRSVYRIYAYGNAEAPVLEGNLNLGENNLSLKALPSGLYTLETASYATSEAGKQYEDKDSRLILKISPDKGAALPSEVSSFFLERDGKNGELSIFAGSGRGDIVVAAELYGGVLNLLDKALVRIEGGSVGEISFERKTEYPESVGMQVFYFQNREDFQYSAEFTVPKEEENTDYGLPLSFSGFTDKAVPGTQYSLGIKTSPDAECAVSIFDIASEAFRSNEWREIRPYKSSQGVEMPDIAAVCGVDELSGMMYARGLSMMKLSSKAAAYSVDAVALAEDTATEEVASLGAANTDATSEEEMTASVREHFEKTLAWEPALLSGKNGEVQLQFKTSDKLSTYRVQVFSHDKAMHNSTASRDFIVTLPVKLNIVPANILYVNDLYTSRVSLSNSTESPVKGRVSIEFLNGESKDSPVISSGSESITIPAGGTSEFSLSLKVPELSTLGILASFSSEGGADGASFRDAMLESVRVLPAEQTITESHSALLREGSSRDSLIATLRGQFVNADGDAAEVKEISIIDMLKGALSESVSASSVNVIGLSSALYSDVLLSKIDGMESKRLSPEDRTVLISKILSCRNADGGFAWIEGFTSSPIVTSKLLERFHLMGESLPEEFRSLIPSAVEFLDNAYFGKNGASSWFNCIGMEPYLYVRSMYPEISFNSDGIKKSTLKNFRKEAKKHLVPASSESRKLSGGILSKVRRIKTLDALTESSEGLSLASSWGIRTLRESRLKSSVEKDIISLTQYAVEHSSGGVYFPNAVTYRGLMDSELAAHAALCEVLETHGESSLSEGIRTWIMIQKETQQWESDPSYIEALSCVLKAKPQTLSLKVIALTASKSLPFNKIKESHNGISIEREYIRADGTSLHEGDTLRLGERIKAVLKVNNDENRSFVRVSLPFPGALRPVVQTSGVCHSRQGDMFTGYMGYCNVRSEQQEYLFEAYPEFKTEIETEYFVVSEGTFSSPAPTIECMYAPHYRANGLASQMTSREE